MTTLGDILHWCSEHLCSIMVILYITCIIIAHRSVKKQFREDRGDRYDWGDASLTIALSFIWPILCFILLSAFMCGDFTSKTNPNHKIPPKWL